MLHENRVEIHFLFKLRTPHHHILSLFFPYPAKNVIMAAPKAPKDKRSLSNILFLQWVYLILALGYNVVSFILLKTQGTGLAQTSPIFGFVAELCITGPAPILGSFGKTMPLHFAYYLFLAVFLCFVGGVLPHVKAYLSGDYQDKYLSIYSLLAAVVVNSFGTLVFLHSTKVALDARKNKGSKTK